MQKAEQLMSLLDRTKDRGNYDLANLIFAVILYCTMKRPGAPDRKEIGEVKIEWLTHDPDVRDPENSSYDLIGIKQGQSRICIPAIIVHQSYIIAVMKRAHILSYGLHDRDRRNAPDSEADDLWQQTAALVDPKKMLAAVRFVLAEEWRGEQFASRLYSLVSAKFGLQIPWPQKRIKTVF